MNKLIYKLLDWIDINKLNWSCLCENPNAVQLLKQNPKKINWDMIAKNSNYEALEIIKNNLNKIFLDFVTIF